MCLEMRGYKGMRASGIEGCIKFTEEEYHKEHDKLLDAYYRGTLFGYNEVDTDIGKYHVKDNMCILGSLNSKPITKEGIIHIPVGFDKLDITVKGRELKAKVLDLGSLSYVCIIIPNTIKVLYAPYLKALYNFTLYYADIDVLYAPSVKSVGYSVFDGCKIRSGIIGDYEFNNYDEFYSLVHSGNLHPLNMSGGEI